MQFLHLQKQYIKYGKSFVIFKRLYSEVNNSGGEKFKIQTSLLEISRNTNWNTNLLTLWTKLKKLPLI